MCCACEIYQCSLISDLNDEMDGETDVVESCEAGNSEPSILQNDVVIKRDEDSDFQDHSEDVLVDVTNDKV